MDGWAGIKVCASNGCCKSVMGKAKSAPGMGSLGLGA